MVDSYLLLKEAVDFRISLYLSQICDWLKRFMQVILTNKIPGCGDITPRPGWRQVLLYKCTEAAEQLTCQHHGSKHSACTASVNENIVDGSILLGS